MAGPDPRMKSKRILTKEQAACSRAYWTEVLARRVVAPANKRLAYNGFIPGLGNTDPMNTGSIRGAVVGGNVNAVGAVLNKAVTTIHAQGPRIVPHAAIIHAAAQHGLPASPPAVPNALAVNQALNNQATLSQPDWAVQGLNGPATAHLNIHAPRGKQTAGRKLVRGPTNRPMPVAHAQMRRAQHSGFIPGLGSLGDPIAAPGTSTNPTFITPVGISPGQPGYVAPTDLTSAISQALNTAGSTLQAKYQADAATANANAAAANAKMAQATADRAGATSMLGGKGGSSTIFLILGGLAAVGLGLYLTRKKKKAA